MIFQRRKTKEVFVGNVAIGNNNPIRIQSMTNTDPLNISSTVKQIIGLNNAHCEMVRLAIPDQKSALAIKKIQLKLKQQAIQIPIIADIHFNREAALISAEYADKIRINPGNYSLGNINEINSNFIPLITKLKKRDLALRIGVNHGSLSKRILDKYGNTVKGMVVSAIEYIKLAERNGFFNIILSMKSSMPDIMIQAYLKLVKEMDKNNMPYPLHLGVTEAGNGQIGRVKSSFGVGSLLLDGLGDTIRVSLTEDPKQEIPVAKKLVKAISNVTKLVNHFDLKIKPLPINKKTYNTKIQNKNPITVGRIVNSSVTKKELINCGLYNNKNNYLKKERALDFILYQNDITYKKSLSPLFNQFQIFTKKEQTKNFAFIDLDKAELKITKTMLSKDNLIVKASDDIFYHKINILLKFLEKENIYKNIFIHYSSNKKLETNIINFSMTVGKLITKWNIKGIIIDCKYINIPNCIELVYDLFQATKKRITETEFISCPTCGRTSFDLQKAVNQIKSKTSHLKGLKIAIMGCIVNGPGEMGDADYGYIGTRSQNVTLFKGKEVIKKNLDPSKALDALLTQIKKDGRWISPPIDN